MDRVPSAIAGGPRCDSAYYEKFAAIPGGILLDQTIAVKVDAISLATLAFDFAE